MKWHYYNLIAITNQPSHVIGVSVFSLEGKHKCYLLNPAGVMFGAYAGLDISGSFHVSTANYLRLGESDRFYSSSMEGEVLSTEAPTAFGFLGENVVF